ncbi:hypothetical protein [Escherichia coli]|uniref:hypothetical protein n=1 Tax=Escherichia coli TaxID=562 RepID=UPI00328F3D3C
MMIYLLKQENRDKGTGTRKCSPAAGESAETGKVEVLNEFRQRGVREKARAKVIAASKKITW